LNWMKLAEKEAKNTIIMGDFNATPKELGYKLFEKDGYKSSYV